jgi:MFS transporter, SP family, arabinose:H+ symporter
VGGWDDAEDHGPHFRRAGAGMKLNATLMKSTVVAALGGLLFGFDTAVISGTTGALTQTFSLTPFFLGVTVFSALFGTV